MTKIFPAEHTPFYSEFEPWYKSLKDIEVPNSGVYCLRTKKEIGRLLGPDKDGIMYIGKGIILSSNTRLGKFVNALNSRETRHDGGLRFTNKKIRSMYEVKDLFIEVTLTEKPEDLEARMLEEYAEKYGEMPPFNRKMESIKK